MNKLKNQVVSGVKWNTIGTIVIALVALMKLSVLARFLEKTDFGLMALVTFVMGFMNLFNDMGLTSAILHKQDISKKEYASLYWLNIGFSIVLYVLLLAVTPFVSNFYDEPRLNALIPLLGLNLVISATGRIYKTIEAKHLKFKTITIFEIFAGLSSLVFAIYLAMNDYGVLALVYSALVQYSLQNILYLVFGLKNYGLLLHFKLEDTKPFLNIGIYQVGGQIANYFNRDLDILIIGKFFSQEILGGYSLAKQLVFRPAQILNPIITKVASPTLALVQHQKEVLKANYLRLIGMVSKVNIVVYLGLIIFAPIIVSIFYGDGFEEIVSVVRILSIYMIIRAIGNPMGSLIIATGKTKIEFYWNLGLTFIIPVFIYFGSFFGVVGVAWALSISSLLLFYPGWKILVHKIIGGTFKEYIWAIVKLRF